MAEYYRNFRSNYYDKVGFRGVEERKSLEILLAEKPLNVTKLSQFCIRFSLPTKYREYVWSIILGILPLNPENHPLIQNELKAQYEDLKHALLVMNKVNDDTPGPQLLAYVVLLEEGQLRFNTEKQFQEKETKDLLAIASTVTRFCSDQCSAYLLTKQFWKIQRKFVETKPQIMLEKFGDHLKQEDPDLYNHLFSVSALSVLPIEKWFCHFFADVLPDNALERVWDKIAAGNCRVLICVASALLTTLRRSLLSLNNPEEIVQTLSNIKIAEENADRIVNSAFEYCHQVFNSNLLSQKTGTVYM